MATKEKFEEAKRLYETANADQRYVLESLFPELKESEDERVSKEIISAIKEDWPGHTDWIAWLERQGEQNKWKPSKDEMDALYGLAYITNQYDEQKEEVITRLYQDLKREFFNGSSYENMFPNTEDSVRRRSTIQVLEYAKSLDTYNQFGKADIDKNIAWLEKQEQKPAWSEEDGKNLEKAIWYVEKGGKLIFAKTDKLVSWLKSLRPKSQWKPSERQKEALLWCVVHLGGADKQALGELLEELNKL